MTLKKLLQEVSSSITSNTVERGYILEALSGKENLHEITLYLKETCELAVIQTNPTIYSVNLLKKCLKDDEDEIPPNMSLDFTEPDLSNSHAADGRVDPNQPKIVKTQSYKELEELIHPDYPMNIYISGQTGLGKSTAVLAIAKRFNIPVIRVNLSAGTDIDDLIGGIRIVDGNTIFEPGPVAIGMELGAILLLDEVDAGNPKVLIELHPVLEKKGVLAKKARKMIYPKKGFCVIATGNTKGVGDDTGKYIGVNNLNHAFLQRFGASIEFMPPTKSEMMTMMENDMPSLAHSINKNLCMWYEHVLSSHSSGAIDEYINPRKLLDIGKVCLILNAKTSTDPVILKAIKLSISLYDISIVEALCKLYDTIAINFEEEEPDGQHIIPEPNLFDLDGNEIPF